MVASIDMQGKTINGVSVLSKAGSKGGKTLWHCKCPCGSVFEAVGSTLRKNFGAGCSACRKANAVQAATKHGAVDSPEYIAYHAMKQRCYYAKGRSFPRYGGRGIKVCDRWLASFANFQQDMGPKPSPTHSIERLDVDGDYEPGNCVWATVAEQANNRSNNTRIEINGRTQNLIEWSRESGVHRTAILRRLKRGLTGEQLIHKGIIR